MNLYSKKRAPTARQPVPINHCDCSLTRIVPMPWLVTEEFAEGPTDQGNLSSFIYFNKIPIVHILQQHQNQYQSISVGMNQLLNPWHLEEWRDSVTKNFLNHHHLKGWPSFASIPIQSRTNKCSDKLISSCSKLTTSRRRPFPNFKLAFPGKSHSRREKMPF